MSSLSLLCPSKPATSLEIPEGEGSPGPFTGGASVPQFLVFRTYSRPNARYSCSLGGLVLLSSMTLVCGNLQKEFLTPPPTNMYFEYGKRHADPQEIDNSKTRQNPGELRQASMPPMILDLKGHLLCQLRSHPKEPEDP